MRRLTDSELFPNGLDAISDSAITKLLDSLCWRCSKAQGFYQNPCPHCGATNPNVEFDKAMAECSQTWEKQA